MTSRPVSPPATREHSSVARFAIRFLIFTAFISLTATAAFAGLVDSPTPTLGGQPSRVIAFIPGAIKNNSLETLVTCTNLERSATVTIGVEFFDELGAGPLNDVSTPTGSEVIALGGTVTFASGATAGFTETNIVNLPPTVLNIKNGSARVVSTSKRIACHAFVADDLLQPPTSIMDLPVIIKKQQGD